MSTKNETHERDFLEQMSNYLPSLKEGTPSSLSVSAFPRALEGVVRFAGGSSTTFMPSLDISISMPAWSAKK